MARPSRNLVSRARKAQAKADPPIRFVADHDHVTPGLTIAYKAGHVVEEPAPELRAEALRLRRAVEVR